MFEYWLYIKTEDVKNSSYYCYMHGSYTFYRSDVKNTGYATFSCSIKECKARMTCRCSSKEAAQDSEEEPQLLRL